MADHSHDEAHPGYETTDAQIRPLLNTGLAVALLMAAALLSVIPLFKVLNYYQPLLFDEPVPPLAQERVRAQAPRLQIDPPRQKFLLRQQEETLLNSYGWVDEQARIARIPIGRAIELVDAGLLSLPRAATPR